MATPTLDQYGDFQAAFQHLNLELFGGALPDTMLTLARSRHASGYIIPDGFHMRGQEGGEKTPEIGLNPIRFANRTAEEVLGALLAEMVKLAQHADGTGSPDNYLNKDYYRRMEALREPFQVAAAHLIANGWAVRYVAPRITEREAQRQESKRNSKTKYTCPITGQNAWAKPGATLYTREGANAGQPMQAQAAEG